MMLIIKPRLKTSYYGGGWVCVSRGMIGCGSTPKEAYDNWVKVVQKNIE